MKTIIYTLFLLLIHSTMYAQTTEPCELKGIVTDPANPQNIPQSWNGSVFRVFPWTAEPDYDWYYGVEPTFMNPFRNINDPDFQFLLEADPALRDNLPENGWELLAYNDGQDYNSANPFQRSDASKPYIILYNKYRSLLRAFFYYDSDLVNTEYDVASVILSFSENDEPSKQSANFNAFADEYHAIASFKKNLHSQTVNKFSTDDYQWIYADFPMSYDPCVCQFEYDRFKFSVNLIDSAQVFLDGSIKTLDVISKKGKSHDINNGLAGGSKVGESLTKALKVYDNDKALISKLGSLINYELKDSSKLKKKKLIIDNTTGGYKTLSTIAKGIPYVGMALSLIDNLTADATTTNAPTAVSFDASVNLTGSITYTQEDATVAYLKVPGSIRTTANYADEHQPLYDEPMGIITLMETPELEYVDYYADANEIISQSNFHGPDNKGRRWTFSRNNWIPFIRQYKPKNVPKVAINPAAGLDLVDLRFTYRIVANKRDLAHYESSIFIGNMYTKYYTRNFTNDLNKFREHYKIYNYGGGRKLTEKSIDIHPYPVVDFFNYYPTDTSASFFDPRMNQSGMDFEQWNYNPGNQTYPYILPLSILEDQTPGVGIVNTQYLPYSYLPHQTFFTYRGYQLKESRYNYNNYSNFEFKPLEDEYMPEFELKIVAIFQRQNQPSSDPIVVQKVFPAKLVETDDESAQGSCSVTVQHLGGASQFHLVSPNGWQQPFWPDPLRLPFDLTLENTSVGPGDIQALNNIYIGDNVTIAPGTNFYAGNSIEVTGADVVIPPTSVLEIRPPQGITPIQPNEYLLADASEYCIDRNKYNPEVSNKRQPESTSKTSKSTHETTPFSLHPNPAQDIVYISGVAPDDIAQVVCMDVLGRVIHQWEGYGESLDVSQLPTGVFLIKVYFSDGRISKTEKLSIQR